MLLTSFDFIPSLRRPGAGAVREGDPMELPVPAMAVMLLGAVLATAVIALVARGRGGRFRGLPGWAGFWGAFAALLICLSLAPVWLSFVLLAALMFASLRAFFFVAPVRPKDRYAILAAYLAIPMALWPAFTGSERTFLALVPVALFLTLPVLLSFGRTHAGLLDSMGRILMGAVFFVYCTAHLGLLAHGGSGKLELFGLLVLGAELPQRLLGRVVAGSGMFRGLLGVAIGTGIAVGAGAFLAEFAGLESGIGSLAGLGVAVAVTAGSVVTDAVAEDLDLGSSTRLGRGAFLDRTVPALYAVPVYFHILHWLT